MAAMQCRRHFSIMSKTVQVIALKSHEWAKKFRKAGEVYDVDPTDDRFDALLKLGLAEIVQSEPADPPKGRYQRRDLRARE